MSVGAIQKIKVHSIDVDDFLKKVINSERFEAIANKIADKAAEKIKNMKNFEMMPVVRDKVDGEAAFRVSEFETKEKPRNKTQKPAKTSTIEVITETIKQMSRNPYKGLQLRFKQFTKSHDAAIDTVHSKEEERDISKNNNAYEDKIKSMEITGMLSKEKENVNFTQNKNDKKQKQAEYKPESSIEAPKSQENLVEQPQVPLLRSQALHSIEDTDTEEIEIAAVKDKNMQKSEAILRRRSNEEYSKTEKAIEMRDTPSLEDGESDDYDADLHSKVISPIGLDNQTLDSPTLLRKEGDKLYTHQKSPDYAEYHELTQKSKIMEKH